MLIFHTFFAYQSVFSYLCRSDENKQINYYSSMYRTDCYYSVGALRAYKHTFVIYIGNLLGSNHLFDVCHVGVDRHVRDLLHIDKNILVRQTASLNRIICDSRTCYNMRTGLGNTCPKKGYRNNAFRYRGHFNSTHIRRTDSSRNNVAQTSQISASQMAGLGFDGALLRIDANRLHRLNHRLP